MLFWDYLGSLIIGYSIASRRLLVVYVVSGVLTLQSVLRCQAERISVEVLRFLTVGSCSFENVSVIAPAHTHVEGLFMK